MEFSAQLEQLNCYRFTAILLQFSQQWLLCKRLRYLAGL